MSDATYILIRHANAEAADQDEMRELSELGIQQATATRAILEAQGYLSSQRRVGISSGTVRARATAEIILSSEAPLLIVKELYTRGWTEDVYAVVSDIKKMAESHGAEVIFIFGHGETLNLVGLELCRHRSNQILRGDIPDYAEGFIIRGSEVRRLQRSE